MVGAYCACSLEGLGPSKEDGAPRSGGSNVRLAWALLAPRQGAAVPGVYGRNEMQICYGMGGGEAEGVCVVGGEGSIVTLAATHETRR